MAELQKHFGPTSPFMPPGFPLPKLLEEMPRPPFHHLPFPTIPTSAGHPSLPQQFPFSPFGFPGPLGRPRDFSPPEEQRPRSASPPRDHRPPPPLLHPAILAAQSPDFAHMKHVQDRENDRPVSETSSDDLTKFDSKFDRMDFGNSPFSMASMSGKKAVQVKSTLAVSPIYYIPPPFLLFVFISRPAGHTALLSLLLGCWFLFLGLADRPSHTPNRSPSTNSTKTAKAVA